MTQLAHIVLSIAFALAGIRCNAQSSSWFTHLPGCFSGFLLIFFFISFSSHIISGFGTYTDYIELIRLSVAINIMIVVLFQRKTWDQLYTNLTNEFNEFIITSSVIRENSRKTRALVIILIMFVSIDLLPVFFLYSSENCSSFFCPLRIKKRGFEIVMCISGSLSLGFIVDGITVYAVIFFGYIFISIDCIHDELYERCLKLAPLDRFVSETDGKVEERLSILQKIRSNYRKISQIKRKFEKSLSLIPFVWLTGYLCQSYLCLLRTSFTSGPIWRKFFLSWTTFSISTILLIFIASITGGSMKKDSRLSHIIIERCLNHRSKALGIDLNLDEILFREDVFRISHVPITVFGLAELKFSSLPIFFSIVIHMVAMCYQEVSKLPGMM